MVRNTREKVFYLLILIGAALVIVYIATSYEYKKFIGMAGFLILMTGLFNLSKTIKEKPVKKDSFVVTEELEEDQNQQDDAIENRR
ncbi:hypothetical protein ACFQ1M_01840 [Sungkyunkwania multivorans]|uniref:Uncharacterized protein n=1 Tax=Sungkyunkwania multivorans TaxID=1173618 RepID=A0ABW3CTZ1_9FLAO